MDKKIIGAAVVLVVALAAGFYFKKTVFRKDNSSTVRVEEMREGMRDEMEKEMREEMEDRRADEMRERGDEDMDNVEKEMVKSELMLDVLSSQSPGDVVVVDEVNIPGGYVVVHKDDGGKPGAVIGRSGLIEDSQKMLEISLDVDLMKGDVVYVMLHKDDGDGEYEFPGDDAPARDANGDVVVKKVMIE